MTPEQKAAAAKAKLATKAAAFKRVLASDDGREMMKYLRQEFIGHLRDASPHGPAYHVGAADVLGYIELMNDFKEE